MFLPFQVEYKNYVKTKFNDKSEEEKAYEK